MLRWALGLGRGFVETEAVFTKLAQQGGGVDVENHRGAAEAGGAAQDERDVALLVFFEGDEFWCGAIFACGVFSRNHNRGIKIFMVGMSAD